MNSYYFINKTKYKKCVKILKTPEESVQKTKFDVILVTDTRVLSF